MSLELDTTLGPVTVPITRERLVRYAGASGDFNPIHYSDVAARDLGLEGVLAHGMLTMGVALRVVTDWVGDPSRVRSYAVRFTRPVAVPDGVEVPLEVSGRVTAVEEGRATVTLDVLVDGVSVLGSARVEVDRD